MRTRGRLVLIGIDGAAFGLVARLAADGTLPHLKGLIEGGTFRPMVSSLPEVSPVAWSSIITGADPAAHGTFGFTDLAPQSYRTVFANADTLAVQPFWNRAGQGRSVVINVPFTYPARPLDGVLISGFVALDLEKATYPPSLLPVLRSLDYRTDVDSKRAHQSLDLFVRDLDRTLQARVETYRYLWDAEPWQAFVLVFTGTDRLCHFLWDAYLDAGHRYHEAFIDHFRQVDAAVGEIAARLRPGDLMVVVSDHGFERLRQNVYLNAVLCDAGILHFETAKPRAIREISSRARAFALEPSRVYVHSQDKYPKGGVMAAEREGVLKEVADLLRDLTFEGQRVIKKVYRKEEIYEGPLLDRAPDLVLLAEPGFNLRGGLSASSRFGIDLHTGKHARENAILLVYGDHDPHEVPPNPQVADVVSISDRIRSGGA